MLGGPASRAQGRHMKLSVCGVTKCCCVVLLAGGLTARPTFAQSAPPPPAPAVDQPVESKDQPEQKRDLGIGQKPDLGLKHIFGNTFGDLRRMGRDNRLTFLAIGGALAATAHSIDRSTTARLASDSSRDLFVPGKILGGATAQFGASLATYGVGRLFGSTRTAEVGSHLIRAQLIAQGVTHAVKYSVRRMRPDGSTRNSFPSGHTSVSFASATVLQREFGWKVGIPAYAVASYVGVARIGGKRHYLSDVVFGAAIGIVAGRSVTVGRGDKRFLVTPVATRGGGGVTFVWAGQR
jgi:membrane-associated phospholipid phosphatase